MNDKAMKKYVMKYRSAAEDGLNGWDELVTASGEYSRKSQGQAVFLNPATKLEKERYAKRLKVNNIYANEWKLR